MANLTDNAGQSLTTSGRFATTISASANITLPGGTTPARKVVRILVVSGTGTLAVYDNTAASGTEIYAKTAVAVGDIYVLDCPLSTGLYVALGASTTVTVIYA